MQSGEIDRALVLIDGMNLFNNARRAYGNSGSDINYSFPNYDITKLASAVCVAVGSQLAETRFYTGVPRLTMDAPKHYFWSAKTREMRRSGVEVYARALRDSDPPQEKGVDLRIGLDALALAHQRTYDTLIIFSTDQDFTEVGEHVERVARSQGRAIRFISAYPYARGSKIWGINGFRHVRIPQDVYEQCIDPKDYRPRRGRH